MDKKVITSVLLSATLLVSPMTAFAQNANDPVVPRDINSSIDRDSEVVGATDTGGNTLSWLWLLPLLAIPVLYFMVRGSEDREGHRQTGPFSGVKGGRTERRDDEEDREEVL